MKNGLSRRKFLAQAAAGAAGLSVLPGISAADEGRPPRPNVIYIMADDLGYGDPGCYGQQQIKTPNIDRLAKEGTRFTQCYSGSTVCAPSRCSLMTGLHTGHTRIRDNIPHEIWLQPDDITLAEVLKQAGYRTGAIGKWSLGNPGSWGVANWQGFDYFYGHLSQDQAHFYYPDYLWENDKVVELSGNRAERRVEYTHDLFTEKGLGFIRENAQRPFFLYMAYTVPHWSDFDHDTPESQIVPSDEPYSDKPWPQVEKNYAAMVTRLDRDVGRMMALLKELGLDGNTLVFFTSDNGPCAAASHSVEFFNSNGPFRGVKRELYEGGIRVPMIARWPGRVPAGRVSGQIWAFWDVLPTLAEIAGLPGPKNIDGVSMAPALLGEPQPNQHHYLYWDYAHVRGTFSQAVRTGNWKGIRQGLDGDMELYNLSQDPGEEHDVAGANRAVVARIAALMEEAYVPTPDYPIKPAR